MKALQFNEYGDPGVLFVGEAAEPHAGPGQVRIAVYAAGVSPGDDAMRSGAWKAFVPLALPHIVGLDAAGVVDEVGDGVDAVRVGDEVFGFASRGRTTAEYAVLEAWTGKPEAMTWAQAGGAAGSIETSVRVLDALGVKEGMTLLVDGAAGGVGAILVQLAVARGARVIGTASPANHEFLESLGAQAIQYGPGLAGRVRGPVDGAVDVSGRGPIEELTGLTASVVTIASGRTGVRLLRFDPSGDHGTALALGARLVAEGRLVVHVDTQYTLNQGTEAHAKVAGGRARGKVVIMVR
jgi:NADPH:quinone reductase-like Zn-dependent oxidoreductase